MQPKYFVIILFFHCLLFLHRFSKPCLQIMFSLLIVAAAVHDIFCIFLRNHLNLLSDVRVCTSLFVVPSADLHCTHSSVVFSVIVCLKVIGQEVIFPTDRCRFLTEYILCAPNFSFASESAKVDLQPLSEFVEINFLDR